VKNEQLIELKAQLQMSKGLMVALRVFAFCAVGAGCCALEI